ncbi:MAG: ABC transporter ATP-binding protein [Planctomycetota bacterium]
MSANTVIELVDVDKTFANGTTALRSFNLRLQQGEFTSLVGTSGCGKSTVLRLIAGLSRTTSGELRREQPEGESSDFRIGFVFQEPTLLPWSRVWDNVYLPLRLRGQSKAAARETVNQAIEMVGLADFARVYPRELSGGMKMRVSIARALVTRPQLLLMDEPFGALDEQTRFALNDQLLRLWQQYQLTIAFVTHSVYEAVYLGQRVVVLSSRPGRVTADIEVSGDGQRDGAFRRSGHYHETCERVSQALAASAGVATA